MSSSRGEDRTELAPKAPTLDGHRCQLESRPILSFLAARAVMYVETSTKSAVVAPHHATHRRPDLRAVPSFSRRELTPRTVTRPGRCAATVRLPVDALSGHVPPYRLYASHEPGSPSGGG